ncbi:MAG: HAMP domain-containing sensor histidine kinase [Patescibacteria group bacterium]
MQRDPVPNFVRFVPNSGAPVQLFEDFEKLKFEEKERIRSVRLNDLRSIQKTSLIALIPLALLSFSAGYYVSGRYLDPITKLKKELEKLDSKSIGSKLDSESSDEVGALVESFNDLSVRLQRAFASQEEFVQNAAHELRTPLTIIQTNLDGVIDDNTATPKEIRYAIEQALLGVAQLKSLVNYLLELTTISNTTFEPVSLHQVITEQIVQMRTYAKMNGKDITYVRKAKNTKIMGDKVILGRLVQNLLDNAVKYSVKEANKTIPISVFIDKKGEELQLTVTNQGKPIPVAQRERIFERFVQLEPSRNKKKSGYGLGLSIVKKIVDDLGGRISVTSQDGLNIFTVLFKRARK